MIYSSPDESNELLTSATIDFLKPTGDIGGDCVDQYMRSIRCEVDVQIDGSNASRVVGRVYAHGETVDDTAAPPLSKVRDFTQDSMNPRIWRATNLTFMPGPTVCVPASGTNPQMPPFPQNTAKVWVATSIGWAGNKTKTFGGKCCPPSAIALPAGVSPAVAPSVAISASSPEVTLIYRNLSVNAQGSWLKLPGDLPLRAAKIAINAEKVNWRSGDTHITRCLGRTRLAGENWDYPDCFEYSIVLAQPEIGTYQMLLSQHRTRPQIMTLNPEANVFVRVNDNSFGYADNVGSFGLRIRVLE